MGTFCQLINKAVRPMSRSCYAILNFAGACKTDVCELPEKDVSLLELQGAKNMTNNYLAGHDYLAGPAAELSMDVSERAVLQVTKEELSVLNTRELPTSLLERFWPDSDDNAAFMKSFNELVGIDSSRQTLPDFQVVHIFRGLYVDGEQHHDD